MGEDKRVDIHAIIKRGVGLGDGNSINLQWVKLITGKNYGLHLGVWWPIRIRLHYYRAAVPRLEGDRNKRRVQLLYSVSDEVHINRALQPGYQRSPSDKWTNALNGEGERCCCPDRGCVVRRLIPSILCAGRLP